MPQYMDVQDHIEARTPGAVADAHKKDLETQRMHGVNYHRYWHDTESGKVFCLVAAPSKEAAEQVHRGAHGLVADHIYEVKEGAWHSQRVINDFSMNVSPLAGIEITEGWCVQRWVQSRWRAHRPAFTRLLAQP